MLKSLARNACDMMFTPQIKHLEKESKNAVWDTLYGVHQLWIMEQRSQFTHLAADGVQNVSHGIR